MRRAFVYVLVALALLISACSGSDDGRDTKDASLNPDLSNQIAELDELPKEPLQQAEQSERDPAAVSAALWRLDPCRLIATKPAEPGTVSPLYGPHQCTLAIGGTRIDLVLGASLLVSERKQIGETSIMGTKAYVQPGGPEFGGCTVWLPVGRTEAIRINDEFAECWRVRSVVRRLVKRIDAPSSRHAVPGLPVVETCPLLKHGLGGRIKGREVAYGAQSDRLGIDLCVAADDRNVSEPVMFDLYPSLEMKSYHTQVSALEDGASDIPTPEEEASSGWPADFGAIRGRAVFGAREKNRDSCTMTWAESTTILELDVESCAQGRRVVQRMTKLLDSSTQRRAALQSPLLYNAGADDIQARGACVDYLPLWFGHQYAYTDLQDGPACHPYAEPEIPDDPAETVVAAETDPNVTCALATEAVREEFGDRFQPATLEAFVPLAGREGTVTPRSLRVRPCVFVDPQQKVQIQVFVSSDTPPLTQVNEEILEKNDSPVRLGLGPTHDGIGAGYLIGLGERPDDRGYVAVFGGQRQKATERLENFDTMKLAEADLERVADAIVDQHLVEKS